MTGNCAADVQCFWFSVCEEGFVGEFEASACGEHGIHHEEGAVSQVRCGDILHVDFDVFFVAFFAVCCDEGGVCLVERVKESFVEGESGSQHGADDDAVIVGWHFFHAEGCCDVFFGVVEGAAHLVCHGSCDSFHVSSEERFVSLCVHVAQLRHVTVDDG